MGRLRNRDKGCSTPPGFGGQASLDSWFGMQPQPFAQPGCMNWVMAGGQQFLQNPVPVQQAQQFYPPVPFYQPGMPVPMQAQCQQPPIQGHQVLPLPQQPQMQAFISGTAEQTSSSRQKRPTTPVQDADSSSDESSDHKSRPSKKYRKNSISSSYRNLGGSHIRGMKKVLPLSDRKHTIEFIDPDFNFIRLNTLREEAVDQLIFITVGCVPTLRGSDVIKMRGGKKHALLELFKKEADRLLKSSPEAAHICA